MNTSFTEGNWKGYTPLHWAAKERHTEIVQVLLEAGADFRAAFTGGAWGGWTPLHFAAQAGKLETVQALLEAGAYVNATTNSGGTPLYYARNNAIRSELQEAGATK